MMRRWQRQCGVPRGAGGGGCFCGVHHHPRAPCIQWPLFVYVFSLPFT